VLVSFLKPLMGLRIVIVSWIILRLSKRVTWVVFLTSVVIFRLIVKSVKIK
jgi:hypothetical protein